MLVWKDGKSRQFGKSLTVHLHSGDCCCCEGENSICTGGNCSPMCALWDDTSSVRFPSGLMNIDELTSCTSNICISLVSYHEASIPEFILVKIVAVGGLGGYSTCHSAITITVINQYCSASVKYTAESKAFFCFLPDVFVPHSFLHDAN